MLCFLSTHVSDSPPAHCLVCAFLTIYSLGELPFLYALCLSQRSNLPCSNSSPSLLLSLTLREETGRAEKAIRSRSCTLTDVFVEVLHLADCPAKLQTPQQHNDRKYLKTIW